MKRKRRNRRDFIFEMFKSSIDEKKAKVPTYRDNYHYCEYDQEASEYFSKFLEQCLKLPVDIVNTNDGVQINLNLSLITNSQTQYSSIYGEDYLTFFLTTETFKMSRNHLDVCGYKDPNMFIYFDKKIQETYVRRYKENLFKNVNEILDIVPAIGRDFKINEIFK